MLIVSTKQRDVYRNLAIEEWLLDHADEHGPILFLCVNDPCVVIGKNQNPWRECRLSLMREEGVALARRVSGGGAVYHDAGNLNVGVIVPRTEYREQKQCDLILRTLEKFGVQGLQAGKSSLAVDGKKFSGQAFCYRKQSVLHHGTLLVNADLKRLGRYLGPELDGIETKAVASVPSEVANLSSVAPGLTVETLSAALIETFRGMYGSGGVLACWSEREIPEEELVPMIEKLSSNAWKLCHTPRFSVKLDGTILEVEKGLVVSLAESPLFEDWRAARAHQLMSCTG